MDATQVLAFLAALAVLGGLLYVSVIAERRDPKPARDYKPGDNDFSPYGAFVISGRDWFTGQWKVLQKVDNPHDSISFAFPSEAEWMKKVGESAYEQYRYQNEYQDIKAYYQHEDLLLDVSRTQTVWLNGRWV